ncbi:bifunctional serine/threonine protein kinase/MFS transporter [Streptomyces sp. VRA16 Mangrove soil]|uniref:bifunctional serine/threonine protein kinase/MFS transporter n=1 Tax=Streptomyces sp. VRA16 Mangrove soil TaxID=2817434 RepID=UPI001A9EA0E1|nr:bifunctional serine/threonine protein kinase/MFS transporter [Streptomyces sp. VRA16 Mangrove soil]MBO1333590.1 MFS transporter [Streptomyces sp. VRA16 Mangrove soil]
MDQLIASDPTHMGPYRLIARLGAGGMGLVYLGRSAAGRTVAVKVVQAEYAQNPEFRRRFAREVAAARKVGGDWTADVLDADTDAQTPWVATQYIPGPDLTAVVAKDFGPLPVDSVTVLAHRLAQALRAVHGAGLIHRDLKPSNVLVTVDGPRVIDFGIARAMDSLAQDSLLTRTGMFVGSPGFMSPEQVRGRELTPASDVFCLGAVLVFAATGRLLFGAADAGLNAHLFRVAEEEPDLTGVPEPLLGLVRSCLAKDPAERPTPEEIAQRTQVSSQEEWLPGAVLAQLGRHAAKLLDFAPETRADQQPSVSVPAQAPEPTTALTPASAQGATPSVGFGPPPAPYGAPQWSPPAPPGYAPTVALGDSARPNPHRRQGVVAVALVLLTVSFGASFAGPALNVIERDLHASATELNWLYGGYALGFGALLFLGGLFADRVGRKRMMVVGLSGIAVTALAAGLAPAIPVMIAAAVAQGAFAGLVVPAALSLVAADFPEPRGRAYAFGVYAAVAAGGEWLALVPANWLIEEVSWRSILLAAAGFAVLSVLVVAAAVRDPHGRTAVGSGALSVLTGTFGTVALVYGCFKASLEGWAHPDVVVPLLVGAALFAVSVVGQSRPTTPAQAEPVPGRVRAGAFVALLLVCGGTYAIASSASSFLYNVQGLAPSGISVLLLPLPVALVVGAVLIAPRLRSRFAPPAVIVPGLLLCALGAGVLSLLAPNSSYLPLVPIALVLDGLGLGLALMPLYSLATAGGVGRGTGGDAAMAGAAVQVGGSLGAALLGAAWLSAYQDANRRADTASDAQSLFRSAAVDGSVIGLFWGLALIVLAVLLVAVLVRARTSTAQGAPPSVRA